VLSPCLVPAARHGWHPAAGGRGGQLKLQHPAIGSGKQRARAALISATIYLALSALLLSSAPA